MSLGTLLIGTWVHDFVEVERLWLCCLRYDRLEKMYLSRVSQNLKLVGFGQKVVFDVIVP